MTHNIKYFFISLTLFCSLLTSLGFAQKTETDSILLLIENYKTEDAHKVDLINEYCLKIQDADHDKAFQLAAESYALANKLNYKAGVAASGLLIGFEYSLFQLKYDSASKYALEALRLGEEVNDKKIQSRANNCMSMCYEGSNDTLTLAYRQKALALAKESGDYTLMANYTRNICLLYAKQKNYGMALEGYRKAIEYMNKSKDKTRAAGIYGSLGDLYLNMNNIDSGLFYYNLGLITADEMKYMRLRHGLRNSIANVYFEINDTANGFRYIRDALKIALENNLKAGVMNSYGMLAYRYSKFENYKAAFRYLSLFDSTREFLNMAQSTQNLERMQEKLTQEKKNVIVIEEKKRQQVIIYSVAGVLVVVVIFSVLLYKRFRLANKQKRIIEEKQKEILDSIHYASRIQRALITSEKYISNQLNRLMKN